MNLVDSEVKNNVLEVRNLESAYGPVMALRGVSLEVPEGKVVTILGANGAGKTTLMKTISGVINPRKGAVWFHGERIDGTEPDRLVKKGLSHVPEGREVFPFLNVAENLAMGAYTRRDKSEIQRDVEMIYEYFPILKNRRTQAAGTMSGGQQQMLAIGRGLMSRPSLMLLDEPSLGLSPLLVQEIFAIIRRLNKEQGVTILLVEQNARVALAAADYGYVLETGRIVMAGSADKLMHSDDIKEFYLGQTKDNTAEATRWKRKKTWR
ncbi:ABC transporter ATP-binding protein [Psychrobacter sp. JCM 18900]|uniref:ABC transporter ATP-binding protein n=1 Tax=Psychrobacter sp. JCM 18900 TaxID=1298608 RepID=UPI00191828F9